MNPETSACTNIPIHCECCTSGGSGEVNTQPTIWKYNAHFHLITSHLRNDGSLPDLRPSFIYAIHVFRTEEEAMGLDDDEIDIYRRSMMAPDTDGLEPPEDYYEDDKMEGVVEGMASGGRKRDRTLTITASDQEYYYSES
jgi:hypothetical protein